MEASGEDFFWREEVEDHASLVAAHAASLSTAIDGDAGDAPAQEPFHQACEQADQGQGGFGRGQGQEGVGAEADDVAQAERKDPAREEAEPARQEGLPDAQDGRLQAAVLEARNDSERASATEDAWAGGEQLEVSVQLHPLCSSMQHAEKRAKAVNQWGGESNRACTRHAHDDMNVDHYY